jgi:surfeit locus 1 family protein
VPARSWIPLALAAIVAVVCVRLGLWQLDRLEQRRERNRVIEAGFEAPPVPAESAATSPRATLRFRRVIAAGRWNYGRESVIPGRTRNGSPGVHIVTPLTLGNERTEVLVNRGWVYSPDARSVDLSPWHEGDRVDVIGYVDEPPPSLRAANDQLYVVALADTNSAQEATRPARLSPPPFDEEGPHLNYAVQWFSFAAIALIGTPLVVLRQRRRRE